MLWMSLILSSLRNLASEFASLRITSFRKYVLSFVFLWGKKRKLKYKKEKKGKVDSTNWLVEEIVFLKNILFYFNRAKCWDWVKMLLKLGQSFSTFGTIAKEGKKKKNCLILCIGEWVSKIGLGVHNDFLKIHAPHQLHFLHESLERLWDPVAMIRSEGRPCEFPLPAALNTSRHD